MKAKPTIVKLREFVDALHGDRTSPAGIFGPSSLVEVQTLELKNSFAKWYIDADDAGKKSQFHEALLVSHATSVITDSELDYCEKLLNQGE